MKRFRTALALSFAPLCLLGGDIVHAQEPAQPDTLIIRAAPLRADAVRAATTAGAASALQVEIDSLRAGPAASLEQVLRELPLITVRTNSRGEAQFSLRGSGSDARQVAVMMDGVPVHIGWDDRLDLSVVPASAATSLTLVRGLPSVLHGPNVLGGVVEVSVAQAGAAPREEASISGDIASDNAGAFALSGSATVPLGDDSRPFVLRAGAGFRDRPGVILPDGIEQPGLEQRESPLTGETLRSNTQHRQVNGFLAGRYQSEHGAWVSTASSAYQAERGIAAELHTESQRYWRYPDVRRIVTVVSGGTGHHDSPFGGRGDVELSVGYDAGHTEILSYTSGTYDEVDDTEESDDRTLTVRLLSDQTLGRAGELRLAFSYVDTKHEELLSGTDRYDYRQRIWSGGAETVWSLPTGIARMPSARFSIGGAFDAADTPETGDKPSLDRISDWGLRAGVTSGTADGRMLLHAGASRRARFPALRELYSGALGRFEPNPALQAEVLHAAEAGLTWRPASVELQAVGFFRQLEDAIEQVTLESGRRQRVNLGTVRSAGLELLAATAFGRLSLSGDMTVQTVKLLLDDTVARARPDYQPEIAGGVQTRLLLPHAFAASAEARYTGTQYCLNPDGPGELKLDPSARFDAALSRTFEVRGRGPASRMEVRAGVDNITDRAIYDQCGLPQPGRTLRLQLSIR